MTFFSNEFRPKYKKLRTKPSATDLQICDDFYFTSNIVLAVSISDYLAVNCVCKLSKPTTSPGLNHKYD